MLVIVIIIIAMCFSENCFVVFFLILRYRAENTCLDNGYCDIFFNCVTYCDIFFNWTKSLHSSFNRCTADVHIWTLDL